MAKRETLSFELACPVAVCWALILVHSALLEGGLKAIASSLHNTRFIDSCEQRRTLNDVQIGTPSHLLADDTPLICAILGDIDGIIVAGRDATGPLFARWWQERLIKGVFHA